MRTLFNDLGRWLWRLVPANPILVRVVFAGGRRWSHMIIRLGYLLALFAVVFVGVLLNQSTSASLASLAKQATQVFESVAVIQLLLVCILAPIFAAAAITQEKDSQTFSILLSTPLSNGQIVLGSLLSRLYFVLVLLLASLPLFCIMMVYGGVTGSEISLSLAISAAMATVAASLAIAISVIKVGTGRTIFSFYLAIALYLLSLFALSTVPAFIPPESPPAPGGIDRMSWLAAFHPFLALWAVLNKTPAPDFGAVAHYGFPRAQWLAYPQYSFISMSLLISILVVIASVWFVRRGAKLGEPTWLGRLLSRGGEATGRETSRKPRHVWANPVAWREAQTKAAAGSGGSMRIVLIALGGLAAIALLVSYINGMSRDDVRLWLKALVGVELGLALFIATATAATSMTREKEGNTLDLLLATPLNSADIIGGKLRGLVSFAAVMLAVPSATLLLFVITDLISGRMFRAPGPVVYVDTLIGLPLASVGFTFFACAWGLRTSIYQRRTVTAVLISAAVVLAVFGILGACAYGVTQSSWNEGSAILSPFCPLTAIMMSLDPDRYFTQNNPTGQFSDVKSLRIIALICCAAAAFIYYVASRQVRSSMVHSFDMTIRKQSA